MRCPSCGIDTPPTSPRCTRCDEPLNVPPGPDATVSDDSATVSDETTTFPDQATTSPDENAADPDATAVFPDDSPPKPNDAGTVAYESPAVPWGGQQPQIPVPWEPARGNEYTTPMPPDASDEMTTQLSPEPWSEPAIWQPPAPPKKSNTPYFLAAAGVVLLLGVALGIVFWPSGSDTSANGTPATQGEQSAVPQSSESARGGDPDAQAKAIDELLEQMGGTRSDLGSVVVDGCQESGLQRVLDARKAQLDKARALEASVESNQRYLDGAPGCPSDGEVADVNQRASDAKNEFIGYWTPVAQQVGLPARGPDDL